MNININQDNIHSLTKGAQGLLRFPLTDKDAKL